jgi:predicted regulator of Ras-like GTPase activity (Roadblock/LC7/MglB family)
MLAWFVQTQPRRQTSGTCERRSAAECEATAETANQQYQQAVMKLFNLVKGIFAKPASAPDADAEPAGEVIATETEVATLPSFPTAPVATPVVADSAIEQPPAAAAVEVDVNSSQIVVPLSSLVAALPVELQQRVRSDMVGQATCAFPIDKILSQLAQGLVRVTFGEIRQSAPRAFIGSADRDFVMVNLPLNELVSRLGPALLSRPTRKQIDVPEEITSPFGPQGQGLSFSKRTSDTSLTARPRGAQSVAPVPPAADPRARGNVISMPKPAAPGGTDVFNKKPTAPPIPAPSLPATPAPASAPIPAPAPAGISFQKPPITPTARPVNGHGVHGTNGTNGSNGSNGAHAHTLPLPTTPKAPAPAPAVATLSLMLSSVHDSLPETVRLELAQLKLDLEDARFALPVDQVESGLKCGKVVFSWKQLRSWLKPAVPPTVSAHDNLAVMLPLALVAPLFLGRHKALGGGQKRIVVDDKIPNLFFGFPQAEAAQPEAPAPQPEARVATPVLPTPKPAETNYFVWDDEKEQPQLVDEQVVVTQRPAPAPGTTFASRKATPNEVVTKASLLEGVYGALVALPDGLLVAAKLDPSVNGDTIAALIPQMYAKLSGCTKELRMGELNNLNFTVGNVPWKIFRVNGIFFAAFGCAREPLPTAQLAGLAAELDYKKAQ